MITVFSLRQKLAQRKLVICREYARKSNAAPVKKPRAAKQPRGKKNVLAEYESYLSGDTKAATPPMILRDSHELAERDERDDRALGEAYQLPKQIVMDQKDMERQMAKHLQGAIMTARMLCE